MTRVRHRVSILLAVTAVIGASLVLTAGPTQADPQVTYPVSCDRPNTGITAGLFVNLNDEIPDPIASTAIMQVTETADPVVPGQPSHFDLQLPFPSLSFPPNSYGVTYGTFYLKTVDVTIPIPAGLNASTVTPTETPDRNYVTVSRSGSNINVHVQSPVSGSRIRINTEVANPVAEVETSSGVWTPVAMPTIGMNPTVTGAAGSSIVWKPPSLTNMTIYYVRDFGFVVGRINWVDLLMPCTPDNPNQAIATTTVGSPALSVSTSADETSVVTGATIHLHVTATNTGNVPLSGVTVTDTNAPGCAGSPGALAVGAHATINCTVTASAANIPTFSNSAGADSNETSPVTSNTVNVTVTQAGPTGVSGTMTEAGSGAAVAGGWVAVLRSSDFSLAAGAVADPSGNYSTLVPAGTYYLYLIDPAGRHAAGFHGSPLLVTVAPGAMTDVDPSMTSNRGSVSGTITEQGTGTPIGGAWAVAFSRATGAPELAAIADASGHFSFGDLGAGDHLVIYLDPTGGHSAEYYGDSTDAAHATGVTVAGGADTVANGTPPAQTPVGGGSNISGNVTESGTNLALEGVRVLALRAGDFRFTAAAITDPAGNYSLSVAPGSYKLVFLDGTGHHHMEWYDNLPYYNITQAVSVTAPAVITASLDRNAGTMAGTLTDDPAGTPLNGAWAIAIASNGIAGGAVTAPAGTYSIAGLLAGTYRATFLDPNGGRSQEYWNNASTSGTATPLTIAGGATTTIDAALHHP